MITSCQTSCSLHQYVAVGKLKHILLRECPRPSTALLNRFLMSPRRMASRLAMLPSTMNQFEDVQALIEDAKHDEDHVTTTDEVESRYHHIAGQLTVTYTSSTAVKLGSDSIFASSQGMLTIVSRLRSLLSPLPLESSDGNYATWQRFAKLFYVAGRR